MDFIKLNSIKNIHKLSIAPMMDCTDRHFRMIMRKISSKALLYTEMIVAQSLVYTNKKENFLDFNGGRTSDIDSVWWRRAKNS